MTKRYPVQYACYHCGQSGFFAKDAKGEARPDIKSPGKCPSCRFGSLQRMHWNGFGWH